MTRIIARIRAWMAAPPACDCGSTKNLEHDHFGGPICHKCARPERSK